ncbi:unnamed protein product, partial [Ceratitis capitata]
HLYNYVCSPGLLKPPEYGEYKKAASFIVGNGDRSLFSGFSQSIVLYLAHLQ